MNIKIDLICQYLQSYGWKYSPQNENELLVRFIGESSDTEFHLIIGVEQNWISMTIWPYLMPFPSDKKIDALQLLAYQNSRIKMARLGLTENGEAIMCLDIPSDDVTEEAFHWGLDVISYYADSLYPDFVSFWA